MQTNIPEKLPVPSSVVLPVYMMFSSRKNTRTFMRKNARNYVHRHANIPAVNSLGLGSVKIHSAL